MIIDAWRMIIDAWRSVFTMILREAMLEWLQHLVGVREENHLPQVVK